MSRRILVSLVLLLLLSSAVTAYAGYRWQDPIFEVDGTQVLVDVAYHNVNNDDDLAALIAGTRVTLFVPAGVDARVIDPQGTVSEVNSVETLEASSRDVPILAEVRVPSEYGGERYRVRVLVEVGNHHWNRAGWSDTAISVSASVPR